MCFRGGEGLAIPLCEGRNAGVDRSPGRPGGWSQEERREVMTQFLRMSALALAALVLLGIAACDSPVEPTSEPTPEAPVTVAAPVARTPINPPSPTLPTSADASTTPVPPTIPPSPTLPSSTDASTPSPSPTERPTETLPGPCGELCNYEFWQEGDVGVQDVRAELERGADVNARHSSGDTPLLWAVYLDAAPEIIRLLLDHGADPAAKDAEGTPILTYALVNGRSSEVIRWLLESGADANARNGDTPVLYEAVWFAAHATHPEMVRLGSEDGRDLPKESVEIIQSLLEHGADASAKDDFGQTVLFVYFGTIIEAESHNPDLRVVELLLEHGAEIEVELEDYPAGMVMTYALWAGAGTEIIAFLLEHGADATVRGEDGDTLLHAAALFTAEPQVFQMLLAHGADATAADDFGRTALHLAARVGELDPQAIRVLLDNGADVAARDEDGATPLHEAATHSGPETIRLLMERRADASARDDRMETPLHNAMSDEYGEYIADLEKVQLLLAYGAAVSAVNDDGRTACDRMGVALMRTVTLRPPGTEMTISSARTVSPVPRARARGKSLRETSRPSARRKLTTSRSCSAAWSGSRRPSTIRMASRLKDSGVPVRASKTTTPTGEVLTRVSRSFRARCSSR